MSTVEASPAFSLRGISHGLVVQQYLAGYYHNLPYPSSTQLTKPKQMEDVLVLNQDESQPRYLLNHQGLAKIIYTTGQVSYQHLNQVQRTDWTKQHCGWCRQALTKQPFGLPLNLSLDQHGQVEVETYFHYCGFGCALAALAELEQYPGFERTRLNLRILHRLSQSTEPLRPAPHWHLLQANGGPLTPEQYYQGSYLTLPNLISYPKKIRFQQL